MTVENVMTDAAADKMFEDLGAGSLDLGNEGAGAAEKQNPSPPAKREQNRSENFGDADYENEDDEAFDPESVPVAERKAWPKKYVNALSRRDKQAAKWKADAEAAIKRANDLEAKYGNGAAPAAPGAAAPKPPAAKDAVHPNPKVQALLDKKPKIEDYNDWGLYNEDLAKWGGKIAAAEEITEYSGKQAEERNQEQELNAAKATEDRIVKQAQELIQSNPQYLEILQANADILSNYPQHIVDAFAEAENPALAFIELANEDGALEALAGMSPLKAAMKIAKAEKAAMDKISSAVGEDEGDEDEGDAGNEAANTPAPKPNKRASAAPAPLGASKGASKGQKTLDNLSDTDADDLFKKLQLS